MKAVVKTQPGPGNVELQEVPKPVCKPDTLIVEMKYVGICGTDIHIYHDTFFNEPPVIIGHEFSGVIVEVGNDITKFKVGDRVVVNPVPGWVCGICENCKNGYPVFCTGGLRCHGLNMNGGFAKYVEAGEHVMHRLPDNVSLEVGALAEPLACVVQAVEEMTTINVGDTVLLSGPGPIGLIALALLKLKGCKIIVVGAGPDNDRLALAKKMGADVVVNLGEEDLADVVQRETGGRGVDVAVECSGAGGAVTNALVSLRPTGTFIQMGLIGKEITLNYDLIAYKQVKMFGSYCHSYKSWVRTMQILEQGKINLDMIVSHKLPLSEWKQAFDICENKKGAKVLLYPEE